jgi:hypothetical protein
MRNEVRKAAKSVLKHSAVRIRICVYHRKKPCRSARAMTRIQHFNLITVAVAVELH